MVAKVRWEGLTRVSRPATTAENWILYWFEEHTVSCRRCFRENPCRDGQQRAEEVFHYFRYEGGRLLRRDEERYRNDGNGGILVEVELPHGYRQTLKLLRAIEAVELWLPYSAGRKGDVLRNPVVCTSRSGIQRYSSSREEQSHKMFNRAYTTNLSKNQFR